MIIPDMDIKNKFYVLIIFVIMLFLPIRVESAPAYGTRMPQKNEFFVGAQSYYVFERVLEANHGEIQSLQHFVNISYGVTDWLTLDLKGGAGNIDHEDESRVDLNYAMFVGGGYGFRLRVFEESRFKGVFGFQHISIHPYSRNIGEEKYKSVLDDWQLSFLASYQIKERLTPYLGAKVSRMDNIQWHNGERDRIKSDESQSFGVIFGTDFDISKKVWINIEGQAIDAQAVSASINMRF